MKKWIRKWLGITKVEKAYWENLKEINELKKKLKILSGHAKVGADVCFHDESWAVVCIAGKPEYVSFVRLPKDDARYILNFLRQFERKNRVLDFPMGMGDMVRHELEK